MTTRAAMQRKSIWLALCLVVTQVASVMSSRTSEAIPDGSAPTLLFRGSLIHDVSANGQRIIVSVPSETGTPPTYINRATGERRQLDWSSSWGITSDGQFLLRETDNPLLPDETDSSRDLYRVSIANGSTVRLSNGTYQPIAWSDDGSVVAESPPLLVGGLYYGDRDVVLHRRATATSLMATVAAEYRHFGGQVAVSDNGRYAASSLEALDVKGAARFGATTPTPEFPRLRASVAMARCSAIKLLLSRSVETGQRLPLCVCRLSSIRMFDTGRHTLSTSAGSGPRRPI
jgi:hypothetical protein